MEKIECDIAVIGAGPGGYPAAIRASQNGAMKGLKVVLIEAKEMGGTCLNRGCIPSKVLIANAEAWHQVQNANEFGISVKGASFDYGKMAERKDKIVSGIRKGLEGLLASNLLTILHGYAQFTSPTELKVIGKDNAIVTCKKIIIATGSEPRQIEAFPFDYEKIHDSTSLLALEKLPKSLVIIGGGVIGCEFASLFATLGVEVTILELLPRILPMEASEVSQALTQAFKKRGITIETGVQVQGIDKTKGGVAVKIADGRAFPAEMALVSVGRTLNTSKIGLDKAGIAPLANGMIPVDDKMETPVKGIYAIGDIASKWWLAHVATHQGIVAADNACGIEAHMHYDAVPSVIFTYPEIATVGLSLEDAHKKGHKAKIGAFPFQALGKSKAANQTEGFAQVVVDETTGEILGAQVVGYEASTLISEVVLAMTNELTAECIADTIHAHPTFAEAWLEAAYLAIGKPLHMPPKLSKKKAS